MNRTALRSSVASALLLGLTTSLLFALAGCSRSKATGTDGSALYASACARCHGAEGGGGPGGFGAAPRNFRDHDFQTRTTNEQLKTSITRGKGMSMPSFGTTYDDAQLDAIVAYLRTFDPERK